MERQTVPTTLPHRGYPSSFTRSVSAIQRPLKSPKLQTTTNGIGDLIWSDAPEAASDAFVFGFNESITNGSRQAGEGSHPTAVKWFDDFNKNASKNQNLTFLGAFPNICCLCDCGINWF